MATTTGKPENIFDKLKVTKENLKQSLEWFQNQIKVLSRASYQPNKLLQSQNRLVLNATPGSLYLMKYDPLHAETLKYYDICPVIFFLHRHPDSSKSRTHFYGINLHYLDPKMRLALLKKLYSITNNDRFDATTKIRHSWELLSALSRSNNLGIQNCIKMYRYDHMVSRFLEVPPTSWPMVALLPIENFKKASKQKVWYDSKRNR